MPFHYIFFFFHAFQSHISIIEGFHHYFLTYSFLGRYSSSLSLLCSSSSLFFARLAFLFFFMLSIAILRAAFKGDRVLAIISSMAVLVLALLIYASSSIAVLLQPSLSSSTILPATCCFLLHFTIILLIISPYWACKTDISSWHTVRLWDTTPCIEYWDIASHWPYCIYFLHISLRVERGTGDFKYLLCPLFIHSSVSPILH